MAMTDELEEYEESTDEEDEATTARATRGPYNKAASSVFENEVKESMLDAAVKEIHRLKGKKKRVHEAALRRCCKSSVRTNC
jgi:hypothetical protein